MTKMEVRGGLGLGSCDLASKLNALVNLTSELVSERLLNVCRIVEVVFLFTSC